MSEYKLGLVEAKFAEIIWNNEPISSSELAKICLAELEWKKSTTYTVLKRLCDRGIFVNNNGFVSSLISKKDFYALQSEEVVNDSFSGSLPAFVAAFSSRKKLSDEEINQLQDMINKMRG
ncbi:MAG: BlaI/MecI/CopY family transcriptional regulator [Oscillospiraceae bacterium]|nr:BlaI/MecI/CopY family transcriptional regulator [Oscillospiraceae bacterium]